MSPLRFCILMLFIAFGESAKILYVMPFTGKSHFISQKDIPLELAKRGHEMHVITPYRAGDAPKTYHEIIVDNISVWASLFPKRPNIFDIAKYSFASFQDLLYRSGHLVNELVFNSADVQRFLKEDHKFDLVISELFFQESMYMFAHKYNAPLILVSTFGNSYKANYASRNPLQLSTVYHEYGVASDPLSFIGRLRNFYFAVYDLLYHKFIYMPVHEEYARKYFKDLPQPVPSLDELAANAALVLMNNHFTSDMPAAYLPNFIEVGGLNLKKSNNTLPKDLQKILDDAKEGVVYLNFGSNVVSTDLSEYKLQAFMTVFGELKQTVLMKWEGDSLANKPKNVIMRKWFPQKEVLAHPNIKLFICHGGLIGLLEATSVGVPIIGVPVFGDQYINTLKAAEKGYGEILNYDDITEDKLRELINKVINDESYLANAKEVAVRFNDRPMNGLDTAVWWIEYVIRHKGADFMKSHGLKLSFIEYHMLDVYAFVLTVFALIVFILGKACKIFISLCSKKDEKRKSKRKTN